MYDRFHDRVHAGRQLAAALTKYANRDDVIVLGLPRGGVTVAFEVARRLNAPLDVFVVRKLGVPGQREFAMGALASGGVRILNDRVVEGLHISPEMVDKVVAEELAELGRREIAFRGHHDPPHLEGKIVILVDDGIATGSTIRAAAIAIRRQHPARLIIAVPTAALSSVYELQDEVDEIIALMKPEDFYAVGRWYEDFSEVTDAEVNELLKEAHLWSGEKGHTAAENLIH